MIALKKEEHFQVLVSHNLLKKNQNFEIVPQMLVSITIMLMFIMLSTFVY